MNKENNTPFKVEDVNWEELAGIGILKDELEMSGELDTLLKGEKTNVIRLSLVLLGDGRHATAGAQGRRTAARNPRHQTHRTTVAPPYI